MAPLLAPRCFLLPFRGKKVLWLSHLVQITGCWRKTGGSRRQTFGYLCHFSARLRFYALKQANANRCLITRTHQFDCVSLVAHTGSDGNCCWFPCAGGCRRIGDLCCCSRGLCGPARPVVVKWQITKPPKITAIHASFNGTDLVNVKAAIWVFIEQGCV